MMHSHAGAERGARNVAALLGSPAAQPEMVDAEEEERRLSLLRLQERLSELSVASSEIDLWPSVPPAHRRHKN